MGCICSKGISANEYGEGNARVKESRKSSKRLVSSLRKEDVVVEVDNGGHEATTRLISTEPPIENLESSSGTRDEIEKAEIVVEKSLKPQIQIREPLDAGANSSHLQIARVIGTNNGYNGTQVSPGWPPWLTAVAGEAIKGWVPRKADSFEKLDKIGQGTYSSVYRARDLETGKIVALKKVRFVNMDPESVRFMAREIIILRRLDHPNVMKLEGLVTSRVSGNLYLVFEYMEHDLAGLIASPTVKFTEPQIKCYMRQLFRGLEHCHSRGVLHRDIKGSNLLIDNNGNLKIGDFGLATFYRSKQPLTSRVVTLWYRPPELLLGATNYGVAVDLWSAGCILAELFSGKPIMPGRTEVEQLHKIFKLCGSPSEEYWQRSRLPHATIFKPQHPYKRTVAEVFRDFPSSVLTLLDVLLAVEPESRGSTSSALHSEYFTTKPLACDPSSLPKYPPSKEFDAKLREEEARRQKAASVKGQPQSAYKKGSRESKAVPAPDANAELQESILKRRGQSNAKSNSEIYNPGEGGAPPRGRPQDSLSHSGQLIRSNGFGSSANEEEVPMGSQHSFTSNNTSLFKSQKSFGHQGLGQLSRFSNSVALRGSSRYDMSRDTSIYPNWPEEHLNGAYSQTDDAESSVNHELSHHLLGKASKKDEHAAGKESTTVYASKKNRIHYSGPLLPPGGNIEEILKEHEKQIQHAVRKARMDKTKARKLFGDNGVTESLLHNGGISQ